MHIHAHCIGSLSLLCRHELEESIVILVDWMMDVDGDGRLVHYQSINHLEVVFYLHGSIYFCIGAKSKDSFPLFPLPWVQQKKKKRRGEHRMIDVNLSSNCTNVMQLHTHTVAM